MAKIWQDIDESVEARIRRHKARVADAMADLLDVIEENDFDGFDPLITDGYPFEESFDEMVLRVIAWRDGDKGEG